MTLIATAPYIFGKQALMLALWSLPVDFAVVAIPDLKLGLIFYAGIAGVVRWLGLKLGTFDGLAGVAIGIGMALGLEGIAIPGLGALFPIEANRDNATHYLVSLLCMIIFNRLITFATNWGPK